MREKSSLKRLDILASTAVSDYLDERFYPEMTEGFERVSDKARQISGVDCIFTMNGKRYVCDEKAATQYVNRPLFTFALELSFIDLANNIHDGWLIDKGKVNNSFLFVWVDYVKREPLVSKDDITLMEIALVDRTRIMDYLSGLGWTYPRLMEKMRRIRVNANENLGNLRENGLKFTISPRLVENPINVLIERERLLSLSDFSTKYGG